MELTEQPIEHQLSEDGLTLVSIRRVGNVTYTATETWSDPETAAEDLQGAIQMHERMLYEQATEEMESSPRTHDTFRYLVNRGRLKVLLFTSVGGSPWLIPHLHLKRNSGWTEIGFGWLWAFGYLGIKVGK